MFAVAGEIEAVGSGLTFIVLEAVAVHPFASVAVTKYVVVEAGETIIDEEFAPVFHE